ncbi:hypothetical protein LO772_22080 [Yinghuangia sp. ASG 101]|uniref:hypothetical protein n=1 Tax=Yinghuangia sp. ASG 101 TaxID=2896848 RepID=UPI001E52B7A3|nr:hypothetical protein [Yinghuangia sp. ASG 101]UGQ09605.1 hypothetical protein LO772_22080 [Yinghuangia sp. ASG 101]
MFRAHRAVRTSVAAVAIAAALFTATSCSEAQKAIDCIELGTQLANDISNLQGVINDPQAASRSLDNLSNTLNKATDDIDSQDVKDAVGEMITKVDSMQQQIRDGEVPAADSISLLRSSAETIAKACTS